MKTPGSVNITLVFSHGVVLELCSCTCSPGESGRTRTYQILSGIGSGKLVTTSVLYLC